jgi:hypothetical protein
MAHRFVKLAFSLVVVATMGLFVGCGGSPDNAERSSRRQRDDSITPTEPEPPPRPKPQLPEAKSIADEPDETLTVEEWFAAVRSGGEEIGQYDGKTVRMSGEVLEFDAARYPGVVAAVVGVDSLKVDRFWCARPDETAPWRELSVGDDVTIRGVVTASRLYGPFIYPYVVEQTSGGPMPVLQATELARQFKEDPEAVKEKYESKSIEILVEGEVVRVGVEEEIFPYTATHILKGHDDIEFAVSIPPATKKGSEWIEVGDKVLLLGTMMSPSIESEHKIGLGVATCLTLPPE